MRIGKKPSALDLIEAGYVLTLTVEQIDDILASYPRENTNQIARRLGVSNTTIRYWLRKAGVVMRGRKTSPEIEQVLIEGYLSGLSTGELRDRTGMSKEGIRQILRRHGCTVDGRRRQRRRLNKPPRAPLSTAECKEIGLRYLAGESSGQLATAFETVDTTVFRVLNDLAISRRRHGKIDERMKLTIANEYLAGKSSASIAAQVGLTDTAVLYTLAGLGIERRTRAEARRVYPLNQEAFRELDAETAYWVGFLMADGCVHDGRLVLTLKAGDRRHLRKLADFLQSPGRPIKQIGDYAVSVQFDSASLCESLARWGVVPRKSLIAEARGGIEEWPSFWLGVLDGDGTVYINPKGGAPALKLFGWRVLLAQYADYVESWATDGFRPKVHQNKENLYEVAFAGVRAREFLRHLHTNSPVYLTRKRARARLAWRYRIKAERTMSSSDRLPSRREQASGERGP